MITAKEAKALYDASSVEVLQYLVKIIEPIIIKEAKAGKRRVFIRLGSDESFMQVPKLSPVLETVASELRKLGYTIQTGKDGASYVPRGMLGDDGSGPEYTNYGIFISW